MPGQLDAKGDNRQGVLSRCASGRGDELARALRVLLAWHAGRCGGGAGCHSIALLDWMPLGNLLLADCGFQEAENNSSVGAA